MPMYEYGCLVCDHRFDRLRRMDQADSEVTCPYCGGDHVQRRLSRFAAHTRSAGAVIEVPAPSTSGGCGSGCCGGSCASRN